MIPPNSVERIERGASDVGPAGVYMATQRLGLMHPGNIYNLTLVNGVYSI